MLHLRQSHQRCSCCQFTPAGRAAARLAYNMVRARHGTVVRAHRSPQPGGTSCEPRFELRTCPRHSSPRTHRAACEYRGMRSRSSSAWEHRLRPAVVSAPAWARRRTTTSLHDGPRSFQVGEGGHFLRTTRGARPAYDAGVHQRPRLGGIKCGDAHLEY